MFTFLTFSIIYFLPIIISLYRSSESGLAIFILTILTGWTGIGWFIALGWSLFGKADNAPTRY